MGARLYILIRERRENSSKRLHTSSDSHKTQHANQLHKGTQFVLLNGEIKQFGMAVRMLSYSSVLPKTQFEKQTFFFTVVKSVQIFQDC